MDLFIGYTFTYIYEALPGTNGWLYGADEVAPIDGCTAKAGQGVGFSKKYWRKRCVFFFRQMTSQIGRKTMILFFCILFFGDDEE